MSTRLNVLTIIYITLRQLHDSATKSLATTAKDYKLLKMEKDALEGNCLEISGEILKFARVGFVLTRPERVYGRNAPTNDA